MIDKTTMKQIEKAMILQETIIREYDELKEKALADGTLTEKQKAYFEILQHLRCFC